jgi:nicotinate phosphoribosyltransferase
LLIPIFQNGELVYESPPIHKIREQAAEDLGRFPAGVKRLLNPHLYPVGLELGLHDLKVRLVAEQRDANPPTLPSI